MAFIAPRWSFILCNLDGSVIGEIVGAGDRTVALPLNRVPTASFQLPLWHPSAATILTQDTLLKCYRWDVLGTRTLAFFGPIIGVEESASSDGQSLAVTATGPFWRVSKRVIGDSKAGFSQGNQDLGLIARTVLSTANARVSGAGFTGVGLGNHQNSTSGAVSGWFNKNAAEAIAELSAGIGSFDWEVQPVEPTMPFGAPNAQIGLFHTYTRPKGVQRQDAIFEYGTPRANVTGYNRSISRDSLLNRAILSVSGWPDGVAADANPDNNLVTVNDTTSQNARGLFEEVVNDAGVIDAGLRTKIGQEHLRYRANPREIVTFSPSMNARPQPFTDYVIGDWVRARAVVRGIVRFDAMFRIWGATFKVDQNGNESLDLQLVQE